jgi:UDPglucose 6-dehydrogenase
MNIAVVGTGYVGLVTGAVFADLGNDVMCVDKDEAKIEGLRAGRMPIYEPGLEEVVARNTADGRLVFTTDLGEAVRRADIVFIAVGTPPKATGESDLSAVEEVALGIARVLDRYKVIVNKSTVPVGTGDLVREIIQRNRRRPVDFDVVSNPEFLREGSAIEDTLQPDRIVIGAPNQQVAMTLLELYAPLERPMIITDVHSAEIIKYASNAFLATKISFINEIANICEALGADVKEVAAGMGYDPRIGRAFLDAGLGYGGSCFPKDVKALAHMARTKSKHPQLLETVMEINKHQRRHVVRKLQEVLGDDLKGRAVGIWGLAFKPNTDDLRDAPAIEIMQELKALGATVRACDPVAGPGASRMMADLDLRTDAYQVADGADGVVMCTEWNEYKQLDLARVRSMMRTPVLIDGRNVYDPARMRDLGFVYRAMGRGQNGD